jgi:hypothetical protein
MRRLVILVCVLVLALSVVAPVAAVRQVGGGGANFVAILNGQNEVNAQGVRGQGDPDGFGIAFVNVNDDVNRVCWFITVAGIEPAHLAHIHEAPRDVNGPVRVDLMPPLPNPTSFGCTNNVLEERIDNILNNPAGHYVNVHNPTYPAGAVRGQLKGLFGGMAPPAPTT